MRRPVRPRRWHPCLCLREEFLTFGAPVIEEEAIADVVDCLRSGWIGTGPRVERFERALEDYIGVAHVRCVASGTAALMLALEALSVGAGDEVLVPALTFAACANAVERVGATPVFVDSEPETGLVDLDDAAARVGPHTRAIMPVDLGGRPVDRDRLAAFASRHGLLVVEDASHALGAEWGGRRVGAHGDAAAFSFYATKNLTTIEGGAVATADASVADRVALLAGNGLSAGAWERYSDDGFEHYEVVAPGLKATMTDVQAAVGLHQLGRLDGWIEHRARAWARYDELLSGVALELPAAPAPGSRHARHLYQVGAARDAGIDRDALARSLTAQRIGVGVHYRALHLHRYYRERYRLDPADFPVATDWSQRTLSLPLSPQLSERDQLDVAAALRASLAAPSGVPSA
jgi:dTDP-4-amino-4,6-dideoxygalactose transaminase